MLEIEMMLWRAFVPRWAYQPLSGEGAARYGGRWNPIGEPAIYAACELSTAWAEYNQGFVQHPALIVQMILRKARLVDLTDVGILKKYDLEPSIHQCEWHLLMDQEKMPQTHGLREQFLQEGLHGVIYPSFMSPGGTCVALWRWNEPNTPSLNIIDPDHRLPKTAASWL